MTKEQVLKRLQDLNQAKATLEQQIFQGQSQFNALTGAIQDCQYWMQAFENVEKEHAPKIELTPETPPIDTTTTN